MLTVSSLSIHFGGTYLFDNVSFAVGKRDRVGLVGKNGAGKSTLLKILAGEQEPESGSTARAAEERVGYLPQEGVAASDRAVYDEAETAFADVLALEGRAHAIADELSRRSDADSEAYQTLVHELSDANEAFARLEGWRLRGNVERILLGLGFTETDFARPVAELSGGWQMRVELAKILLRKPDYVLLDEPTNHLDIESLSWLEEFLKSYDGAIILISHDRAFLDAVTTRTLEISLGNVSDYPASYSRYVQMRAERREQQLAAYKNQQKEIADTERFIERFRYKATKANQVQSRVKALEKLERVEIDEEDRDSVRFRFPPAPRSGRAVFEASGVSKRFGDKVVLRNADFALERGEKVAFVGKNGEGKTTFAKMLAGGEDYEGVIVTGHNVVVGYYAQHQAEMLDPNAAAFDIIDRAATGEMRTKIRDLLGAFLFSGDAVYKKVKVLSGGEKSRLALAKLLLEPTNALVLDEPTNHLDMRSKDVLKQALLDYDGALIVVSHDRDFLQGLATRVTEFKGGALREFAGDIYEFLRARNADSLRALEKSEKAGKSDKPEQTPAASEAGTETSASETKSNSQEQREEKKRKEREERRLARLIEQSEQEIAALESSIAAFEARMNDAEFYSSPAVKEELAEHERLRAALDEQMALWSALCEEKEALFTLPA